MKREAIFDTTGIYRYLLWREWNENAPQIGFVMLNPSTADATKDDPTIRRCLNFAFSWGYGSLAIVNLFAYRTPQSQRLRQVRDPIGLENDYYILKLSDQVSTLIFAWGNQGNLLNRSQVVKRLFAHRSNIYCLGRNRNGEPRHPLYLRKNLLPVPF